ncbi:RNA polymerase sigma factor [Gloeobacter morelensis]|uniref:RNA polymerase sigma factor n=1 Tax=Gloeobacter morelensis MG652769 TaxID=2781736 RepID=A0ABY3PP27_9CYAN|nr:RNA polymerase sigma factor [Gloeobacter morelensis]UFP95391.1 RNA polymerase sigma factor [Gloeobacter morelensis MG652769]
MLENPADQIRGRIDDIYRFESRRIFASLIRLLGDFELAEEAMHEAFTAAIEQWPRDGLPANPRTWLVSVGRFRGIDALRRRTRFDASVVRLARQLDAHGTAPDGDEDVEDDRLRLIFTCCHPVLSREAQVAMTLREVCGLTTAAVASAFLVAPAALAQRLVRAKARLREASIPYQVPSAADLPERLDRVLQVIYLVFNEGYLAAAGAALTRADLMAEAIRLGRVLLELLPQAEVAGLLGLLLLQESRRAARTASTGDVVLLEDQDRTLWNQPQIAEGRALVQQALASGRFGRYTLQAAIAAVHATAPSVEATDWARVVALYDLLAQVEPSPVIDLNRAVAVAMRDGPLAGLELIDALLSRGELAHYYLAHAARADLCRRLGRTAEAKTSYRRALALVKQEAERRFLERRLREMG